jgi:hypothetical protein
MGFCCLRLPKGPRGWSPNFFFRRIGPHRWRRIILASKAGLILESAPDVSFLRNFPSLLRRLSHDYLDV